MYISGILLILILVIAVSPNETRKNIFNIIVKLAVFLIAIAFILAFLAVVWFGGNWLWNTYPWSRALILFGAIVFVAGLMGYKLMD